MSSPADDYQFVPAGSDGGGAVIVVLPDEIDIANVTVIAAQLREAAYFWTSAVIADLTRTTFCDAAGFRTLLCACRHAAARNVRFSLACSNLSVLRVHDLLGLGGRLPVYPSAGAALMPHRSGRLTALAEPVERLIVRGTPGAEPTAARCSAGHYPTAPAAENCPPVVKFPSRLGPGFLTEVSGRALGIHARRPS